MYPVLFKIPLFGGITIYSYGMMVALGFVAAILWVTYETRRLGLNTARVMDMVFYVILFGVIGSRIMNVAVSERQSFIENPLMIFKIWEGGLVFFGGLIAGMIVGIWYVRRHKMPVLVMCDVFAPAIAIGHAIGRVGCYLAGCCYGRVVDHPAWYSIIFPVNPRSFAPTGIALYPTQLMEVVGEVVIFAILIVQRKFKRFDGQIIATYLILYSILRSFNEYYRGDTDRGFLIEPWLSTSTFVSIVLFIAGLTLYLKFWRKGGQKV